MLANSADFKTIVFGTIAEKTFSHFLLTLRGKALSLWKNHQTHHWTDYFLWIPRTYFLFHGTNFWLFVGLAWLTGWPQQDLAWVSLSPGLWLVHTKLSSALIGPETPVAPGTGLDEEKGKRHRGLQDGRQCGKFAQMSYLEQYFNQRIYFYIQFSI